MKSFLGTALVVLALTLAGTAAAGPVERFRENDEQADRMAGQAAGNRRSLTSYQDADVGQKTPVPWKALGFLGLVLATVTPFALRSYRQAAGELSPGSRGR